MTDRESMIKGATTRECHRQLARILAYMGAFAVALLATARSSDAQTSLCTVLHFPGSLQTDARGINDAGDVVGWYLDSEGNSHSFLYSGGNYTNIDPPDSLVSAASGINNSGEIVGAYLPDDWECCMIGYSGFVRSAGGGYTTISLGAFETILLSVNNSGMIVGYSHEQGGDIQDPPSGFVLSSSGVERLDGIPRGINSGPVLVGDSNFEAVKWIQGVKSTIDATSGSIAVGISNGSRIVGNRFTTDWEAYIVTAGQFAPMSCPGAVQTTVGGISNAGIVGFYFDAGYNYRAFKTPPLPFNARLRLNAFVSTDFLYHPTDLYIAYGGDDRGFCENCGSSRMEQEVTVFNPAVSATDVADGPYTGVWLTQEYESLTSINYAVTPNRLLPGAKADWELGPPMKTAWGLASMDSADTCTTTRGTPSPTNAMQIHCVFSASDPLVPFAPDIDWDYTANLTFNAGTLHYEISGCHDGFPSHEMYLNGSQLMTYDQVGHTVWEIFPPCDVDVTRTGDVQ